MIFGSCSTKSGQNLPCQSYDNFGECTFRIIGLFVSFGRCRKLLNTAGVGYPRVGFEGEVCFVLGANETSGISQQTYDNVQDARSNEEVSKSEHWNQCQRWNFPLWN